jgi:hypothetical protein
MNSPSKLRFPIIFVVLFTLLAAIWAGWLRIGWVWPPLLSFLPALHGPLMAVGFLGTLIALERAVAIGKLWSYAAPLLMAAGTLIILFFGSVQAGIGLIVLGSVGVTAVSLFMVRYHPALHNITIALGAVCLLVGNSLWLAGWPIFRIAFWWVGFLVLIIVGERLELSRIRRLNRTSYVLFGTAVGLFLAGLVLSLFVYKPGIRLASLGLVAQALWLLHYDIVRLTIRRTGLTRYIAVNLLIGYIWLLVGGLLGMFLQQLVAGPYYDAWLHTIFLGFVFGMIFAHSLIIFPGVAGVIVPFRPAFYGPTVLLQAALILRITGDLTLMPVVRRWGGLLDGIAILWFFGLMAYVAIQDWRGKTG